MDKTRNKFNTKLIVILIAVLIILNFALNYIKNRQKQDNVFNIKSSVVLPLSYKSQGLFVFDEYVIDAYEGIGVDISSKKLFRNMDKLIESANVEVNSNIKEQNIFLKNLKKSEEKIDIEQLTGAINNENFSKMKLTYIDSLESKTKFLESELSFAEEYIKENAIIAKNSGYYINKLDGYESIINLSNIDSYITDDFILAKAESNNNLTGLKYVNNKYYSVIAKVENLQKYIEIGIEKLSFNLEDREIRVSSYEIFKDSKANYYIKMNVKEGLDYALNYRLAPITLQFKKLRTLKVPKEALVEKDGKYGVFMLDQAIVKYAEIKLIDVIDSDAYILGDKEDVYSKSYLEMIEKNNNSLDNDVNHESYININEVKEFSNILIKHEGLKEGDRY